MKIEIPEGFFPPPGVPFETLDQRNVAVAMNNAGVIVVELLTDGTWRQHGWLDGAAQSNLYRIAKTKPVILLTEANAAIGSGLFVWQEQHVNLIEHLLRQASQHPGKRFQVHVTATATEVQQP